METTRPDSSAAASTSTFDRFEEKWFARTRAPRAPKSAPPPKSTPPIGDADADAWFR